MNKKSHNVVCLLPARNCEGDLPGYFESVSRFADAIVALDDGSTDSTKQVLTENPLVKILLSNPVRENYVGWDDSGNRNRLLGAVGPLQPKWIISLDADERISPDDAQALVEFLQDGAIPGVAYGFRVYRMIDNLHTYDESSLWVYRLFPYREGQRFPLTKLHFVPVPTDMPRGHWAKTTLRIQHLSSLTEERRAARYSKYREADPDCKFQNNYQHLLNPPTSIQTWSNRVPGQPLVLWHERHERLRAQILAHPCYTEKLDLRRPALSVIVISQNDRGRIQEVMDALVQQKLEQSFELIFVNSGHDGTAEFVKDRYPEVRVIHLSEPALPGKARNAGLQVASGDYISFCGSHIVLPPHSLQHRVDAHEKGYAMVTGTVLNGTRSWAGWASYFLDHWIALPGRPSTQLESAPSRCSYMMGPLKAIGGFPEDRRVGEDTVVNNRLFELGHKAYFSSNIVDIHKSPCKNLMILIRHHYLRGRGFGRILWEYPGPQKTRKFRLRRIRWLVMKYPLRRIFFIIRGVVRWGKPMRGYFVWSFPLILAGTMSAALGAVSFLLRPEDCVTDRRNREGA
ncbi:MAG: glycosyltransferase [Nitrospirota bacterium]|nr:glycosyltransferase [Nitrospirota bacterium]